MPFIKEGIDRGDHAFHVVDARHRAAHLQRLKQEGIDVLSAQDKGQLEVRRWDDVCTYDLARFDASVVIDVMRTHPMVIVGGILQENPFYVPADEMPKELREPADGSP